MLHVTHACTHPPPDMQAFRHVDSINNIHAIPSHGEDTATKVVMLSWKVITVVSLEYPGKMRSTVSSSQTRHKQLVFAGVSLQGHSENYRSYSLTDIVRQYGRPCVNQLLFVCCESRCNNRGQA